MLLVTDYCLPDLKLLEEKSSCFFTWVPDKTYIVLGASNQLEKALYTDVVEQDKIPVMKRHTGGQTVVITPNNLIISIVFLENKSLQPKAVFRDINSLIISGLENAGIKNLSHMGISDIAISGKKILGSSIYKSKDKLLYHAVLNIGEPSSTFAKYLRHPLTEPNYRMGRKHEDFVSSLIENGYKGSNFECKNLLSNFLLQKHV